MVQYKISIFQRPSFSSSPDIYITTTHTNLRTKYRNKIFAYLYMYVQKCKYFKNVYRISSLCFDLFSS